MFAPGKGPTHSQSHVLPIRNSPDNIVIEFAYWGENWAWTVYSCEDTAEGLVDFYVSNENGEVEEISEIIKFSILEK